MALKAVGLISIFRDARREFRCDLPPEEHWLDRRCREMTDSLVRWMFFFWFSQMLIFFMLDV